MSSSGNYGYFVSQSSTKQLNWDTYSATTRDSLLFDNFITDNNWHHIVVTWDGTTGANGKKAYKDGQLVAQKTSTISSIGTPAYNFRIGEDGLGHYPFSGLIDEVRIYNYARSAEQIKMDYQQGLAAHMK